ncbi:hypothetical protein PENTCL1PPCAC_16774, partial [Pristionchus entomophagus]
MAKPLLVPVVVAIVVLHHDFLCKINGRIGKGNVYATANITKVGNENFSLCEIKLIVKRRLVEFRQRYRSLQKGGQSDKQPRRH